MRRLNRYVSSADQVHSRIASHKKINPLGKMNDKKMNGQK